MGLLGHGTSGEQVWKAGGRLQCAQLQPRSTHLILKLPHVSAYSLSQTTLLTTISAPAEHLGRSGAHMEPLAVLARSSVEGEGGGMSTPLQGDSPQWITRSAGRSPR